MRVDAEVFGEAFEVLVEVQDVDACVLSGSGDRQVGEGKAVGAVRAIGRQVGEGKAVGAVRAIGRQVGGELPMSVSATAIRIFLDH